MEYMMLMVFIIILIFAFMILMSVFQIGGMRTEESENVYKQSLIITRFMLNTPYLNNPRFADGSAFDDSKLTTINCTELKKVVGRNWFAFVWIPSSSGNDVECDTSTYPNCNKWEICKKRKTRTETCVHEVPVNIYRKMSDTMDVGILTVGLYGKCT